MRHLQLFLTIIFLTACTATQTPIITTSLPSQGSGGVVSSGTAFVQPSTVGPYQTPSPIRAVRDIKLEDNMQTMSLIVGDIFTLRLGDVFEWQVELSEAKMLKPVPTFQREPGTQGMYQVVAKGRGTLSATGDPLCAKSTPRCLMPSILFRITLDVK